jgi:hypothetical protein
MYFHLAIVNFRGDEIIIVLPLRRLVYFHSKISYIFCWTSWINITSAQSKSSKILEAQVYSLLSKFSTYCTYKSIFIKYTVSIKYTECDRLTAV